MGKSWILLLKQRANLPTGGATGRMDAGSQSPRQEEGSGPNQHARVQRTDLEEQCAEKSADHECQHQSSK